MEYNTIRDKMTLVEYGRHIKRIVDNCAKVEDRERRNKMALEIIELMGQLNPHLRNVEDFRHKLWDHLFMISEFKLDVDSPYPKTTKAQIIEKPEPLPYPRGVLRHRNYGKLVEGLVEKAKLEQDPEKRAAFAQCIGNYMKLTYVNWNKDNTSDEIIKNDLRILSKGELMLGEEDNISALSKSSSNSTIVNTAVGQKQKKHNNYKQRDKNQPPQPAQQSNRLGGSGNGNNNFKRKKFNKPRPPQPPSVV